MLTFFLRSYAFLYVSILYFFFYVSIMTNSCENYFYFTCKNHPKERESKRLVFASRSDLPILVEKEKSFWKVHFILIFVKKKKDTVNK